MILADSNLLINALFELPLNFADTYEIKVGNDYTGYYHFILKSDVTTSIGFSFSIIGVAIVAIGTSVYVLKRKKK
ncbi:MAG: hypothetical protein HGN29_13550 [Asgard group archaeon]|nr:hypothetical protein [Asgard group archaeon]